MKVVYRQTACDDVIRQFRYYLVERNLPEIASRFRTAVRKTVEFLRQRPRSGARYHFGRSDLRSVPVTGFEAIRIFYSVEDEALHIVRILHGKRDLKRILRSEGSS